MKELRMRCAQIAAVIVIAIVFAVTGASAQDVIKNTTDESGFERQLTEIDLMMQTASQLMSAGEWEAAAAELDRVTKAEPDRLEGWTELARCYKAMKQYENAAVAYFAAHELQPDNLDLLSNLGFAQLNAGQMEQAVATYEKMLTIDPVSYDASVHLGFVYQKAGDYGKAMDHYENALIGNPDDVQTMGSLAQLYADNDRAEASVAMYERAIEAADDEQKNSLRTKLGGAMITAKNFEKAAEVYGALVVDMPDNPAHRFNLGISLLQIKKHREAAPHFEKVIELKPDYAKAYQQVAACYNETGRYGKAINAAQKGLKLTTKTGGLYCAWGRALEKQQLYDEAIDIFQRAVSDPQYGSYAKKQIQRQEDLKKRAKMIKYQG